MSAPADVAAHWTREGALARIDEALRALGHDPAHLTPDILRPMEHLHSGGIATTRDQAAQAGITGDDVVLDIGCGIGGPARWLADKFGCRVTGIDLTPELVAVGQELTRRCGLADRVTLEEGDATALPYEDEAFDLVWCQNVTMNIADKEAFLAGVARVLKPGGRFTFTEYSPGPGGEIAYPVTWAYTAELNHLLPGDELKAAVAEAGFETEVWEDYSDTVLGYAAKAREKAAAEPNPHAKSLGNYLVFGDDQPERTQNTQRNLRERRLIYWMATVVKR